MPQFWIISTFFLVNQRNKVKVNKLTQTRFLHKDKDNNLDELHCEGRDSKFDDGGLAHANVSLVRKA